MSRLLRDGIVEPVDHSDWATPIVPVRKRDGTVRIAVTSRLQSTKSARVTTTQFLGTKTWHTHCQVVINSSNSIFPMHIPSFSSTRNLANTKPSTHTKACLHTIAFVLVCPLHRGSFSAPWRVFFDMCQVV